MPETIWVKAGEGRRVRFPDGSILQNGKSDEVVETSFVIRRLACGDLVKIDPPEPAAAQPAAAEEHA